MGKHFKYIAAIDGGYEQDGLYGYLPDINYRQNLKKLVRDIDNAGVRLRNVMVLTGYPDEDGVEQHETRAVYSPRRDTNMVYHVGEKATAKKPPFTGPFLRLEMGGLLWFDPKTGTWRVVEHNTAWYIITALRGPDDNNNELKKLTTGRIRGLFRDWKANTDISPMMTFGNQGCVTRPTVLDGTVQRALGERLSATQEHFRDHFQHAEEAVKSLWGGWPYQE